jgi:hypothetical protein
MFLSCYRHNGQLASAVDRLALKPNSYSWLSSRRDTE